MLHGTFSVGCFFLCASEGDGVVSRGPAGPAFNGTAGRNPLCPVARLIFKGELDLPASVDGRPVSFPWCPMVRGDVFCLIACAGGVPCRFYVRQGLAVTAKRAHIRRIQRICGGKHVVGCFALRSVWFDRIGATCTRDA